MNEELIAAGHGDDVQFAIINQAASSSHILELTDRVDFPVLQDTVEVDAWGQHGGNKDDIFIFESGLLMTYLPNGGAISIVLSGEPGYSNVKDAILDAINAP